MLKRTGLISPKSESLAFIFVPGRSDAKRLIFIPAKNATTMLQAKVVLQDHGWSDVLDSISKLVHALLRIKL